MKSFELLSGDVGKTPEGAIRYIPQKPLPDTVDEILLLDFKISDGASIALMQMFRNAYETAVGKP